MYAMQVRKLEGPSALERVTLDALEPGPGEVLLEASAIGCNFYDTLITQGRYQQKPDLPFVPGAEAAGVVSAVGEGVERVREGDRALVLLDWGGYASHQIVPEMRVFPIPDGMSFDDAAAFGITYQTAYFGLVHRAAIKPSETVLIHAAAGGTGLAAVQIAKALGAEVFGTAGAPEKLELAREHGCDHVFNYRSDDWLEAVRELAPEGIDVVFDPVGGDAFELSTKHMAFEGRIVIVGFASGTIPSMKMNRVMLKNIAVTGLHWGRYFEEDPNRVLEAQDALNDLYSAGSLKPLVSRTYPLEEAPTALSELSARRTTGKLILHP